MVVVQKVDVGVEAPWLEDSVGDPLDAGFPVVPLMVVSASVLVSQAVETWPFPLTTAALRSAIELFSRDLPATPPTTLVLDWHVPPPFLLFSIFPSYRAFEGVTCENSPSRAIRYLEIATFEQHFALSVLQPSPAPR